MNTKMLLKGTLASAALATGVTVAAPSAHASTTNTKLAQDLAVVSSTSVDYTSLANANPILSDSAQALTSLPKHIKASFSLCG